MLARVRHRRPTGTSTNVASVFAGHVDYRRPIDTVINRVQVLDYDLDGLRRNAGPESQTGT